MFKQVCRKVLKKNWYATKEGTKKELVASLFVEGKLIFGILVLSIIYMGGGAKYGIISKAFFVWLV